MGDVGHYLQQHGVAAVAEPALYQGERAEADVKIPGREMRWLQALSQPSTSADGERGALVVLHDVTRLRHLEHCQALEPPGGDHR
jgi:protein involved in temperature-dependent protein secretion